MFNFIKNLFRPNKKSIQKTIKVSADAELITNELVLASFISILKYLYEEHLFNKNYKCISDFINIDVPTTTKLLNFSELIQVDNKYLYETNILVLAKKYTRLHCKSKNTVFDNWMHKLSSVVYTP